MSEIVETWSEAMGKGGVFMEVSVEVLGKEYGIPVEVLDAPGFVSEFGFMAGVEGWIGPGQLKRKVETKGFGEWLKGRNVEELHSLQRMSSRV
jgi:hypothetical protein